MGNSNFFTIIFHKMDIINSYPMIWVIFKKNKSFKPKNKLILKVTSRSFFGKKKRLAG